MTRGRYKLVLASPQQVNELIYSSGPSPPPPPSEFPKNYLPFQTPRASMASCFYSNGTWRIGRGPNRTGCTFNQFAGELWQARLHQFLTANGIAVVTLNPAFPDTWDWDDPARPLGSGLDQPFLASLFEAMRDGSYGRLGGQRLFDPARTIASGYSSGAQMASWMLELQARGGLPEGVRVVAAAMISGGSHLCYMSPPHAVSQCAKCADSGPCAAPYLIYPPFTCSSDAAKMHDPQHPLCCSYCCPTNVTELYYLENPGAYSSHPPVFLAQSERSDANADLCAGRSYHDTLLAHGVKTAIELIPARYASSYCTGSEGDPASAGSPYLGKTAILPPYHLRNISMATEILD
eukprot:COSAG01_NODE_3648_length_5827_cov_4.766934_5_plen_349_part_00